MGLISFACKPRSSLLLLGRLWFHLTSAFMAEIKPLFLQMHEVLLPAFGLSAPCWGKRHQPRAELKWPREEKMFRMECMNTYFMSVGSIQPLGFARRRPVSPPFICYSSFFHGPLFLSSLKSWLVLRCCRAETQSRFQPKDVFNNSDQKQLVLLGNIPASYSGELFSIKIVRMLFKAMVQLKKKEACFVFLQKGMYTEMVLCLH